MDFTGSARPFGFTTRMCTSMRCENRSADCTCIDITVSCGGSKRVVAQPAMPSIGTQAASTRTRLGMLEHVRRHQHDAFFGDEETLRVLVAIVANPRAGRQLAV